MLSGLFHRCFFGNALPVIGVGVLTSVSTQLVASTVFALVTAAIAIAAFFVGRKYTPRQ